jgi:hypothetical protein
MNAQLWLQPSRVAASSVRGPAVTRQHAGQEPHLQLGDPGHCPGHPSLTICLFDDSGSVAGPVGTDPMSNRYQEAAAAFQALSRRCRCGRCWAAVIHFDLVGGCGPTSLARRAPRSLIQALAVPTEAAGVSLLGPGLAEAVRLVEGASDVRELALVVFSDFELFDPDLDRLLTDLAGFPGRVHAVILGGHVPAGLDPAIQVTALTSADAPGATARALLRSLSVGRRGARIASEPAAGSRP